MSRLLLISLILLGFLVLFSSSAEAGDYCNWTFQTTCGSGCGYMTRDFEPIEGNCSDWGPCFTYSSGTQPKDENMVDIPDQCYDGTYLDLYCDGATYDYQNNSIILDDDTDGYDQQCDGIGYPSQDCTGSPAFCGGDCNDNNGTIHPFGTELCVDDGVDEDCDGSINEGCSCLDGENQSCEQSGGVCNDYFEYCSSGSFPSCDYVTYNSSYEVTEVTCDYIDNDCDGQVDEGLRNLCNTCDVEICNGLDDDCDGLTDEGFDQDMDGSTTCATPTPDCDDDSSDDAIQYPNSSLRAWDIYPNAIDTCGDNIDQNCDGVISNCSCSPDNDNDGFCVSTGDCDDDTSDDNIQYGGVTYAYLVFPDATEECNDFDDNCNNLTDEGLSVTCSSDNDCPDDSCQEGRCYNGGTCYSYCSFYASTCTDPDPDDETEPPTTRITYPSNEATILAGQVLSFSQISERVTSYSWTFGDGVSSTKSNPTHAYTRAGVYDVELTVTNSQGSSNDDIILFIVECQSHSDCAGLCCSGSCFNPCESNADCGEGGVDDYTFTEFECMLPGTCSSQCSESTCNIECFDDNDCDDSDSDTDDDCNDAGTCDSECEYEFIEPLEITILSPEPTDYQTTSLRLDFTTSRDVDCTYTLNDVTSDATTPPISITANYGTNRVTVSCDDEEESITFRVIDLEEPAPVNVTVPQEVMPLNESELESIIIEVFTLEKLEIVKRLYASENESNISLTIRNTKPITEHDIRVRQIIPKQIVEDASLIYSSMEFIIIENDPIIEFIIDELGPYEQAEIVYAVRKLVTEEEFTQIEEEITSREISQEQIDEAKRKQQETEDASSLTQTVSSENGKTVIEQTLTPEKTLEGVNFYVKIPKCAAEHVSELKFKNKNFKIIADDPLIMWHFEEAVETIVLSYEIEKELDADCLAQLKAMIIAQNVGDELDSGFSFWGLLPAILIPLVGGTIVYFGHFRIAEENIEKAEKELKEIGPILKAPVQAAPIVKPAPPALHIVQQSAPIVQPVVKRDVQPSHPYHHTPTQVHKSQGEELEAKWKETLSFLEEF